MYYIDSEGNTLIYDFLDQPPRLIMPLIGLGFAIYGFYLIVSPLKSTFDNQTDLFGVKNGSKKRIIGFGATFLGLICFSFGLSPLDYFKTRSICKKGDLTIISGSVTNLVIHSGVKHGNMEFYLNGQRFYFTSNDWTDYGCTFPDLEHANIEDSTFLNIAYFVKHGENIVVKVKKINKH